MLDVAKVLNSSYCCQDNFFFLCRSLRVSAGGLRTSRLEYTFAAAMRAVRAQVALGDLIIAAQSVSAAHMRRIFWMVS